MQPQLSGWKPPAQRSGYGSVVIACLGLSSRSARPSEPCDMQSSLNDGKTQALRGPAGLSSRHEVAIRCVLQSSPA